MLRTLFLGNIILVFIEVQLFKFILYIDIDFGREVNERRVLVLLQV